MAGIEPLIETVFPPGAFEGLHARGGEWRIELARIRWDILDAFQEAAAQAGIPKVEDFNRGDNEGCGYFHVNQKTGIRWNTSKFLRAILNFLKKLEFGAKM